MRFHTILSAGLLAAAVAGCTTMSTLPPAKPDHYQWLEQVDSPRALEWVRRQNDRTLAKLRTDPRYPTMKGEALTIANDKGRLPLGEIRGGYVYNFWQDEHHVRGLWRRAPLAEYAAGAPRWESILDVDALAAAEGKNWVFKGVDCLPPEGLRCMVALSDGGKDAAVLREFDIARKAFPADGFVVPEAKSRVIWKNADALYLATDWGPGSLTESGYPFIVREWRRGTPLSEAAEILRGAQTDVGMELADLEGEDGERALLALQGVTFFTANVWRLGGKAPEKLDIPPRATIRTLHKGQLIFTIEQDWSPTPAQKFGNGALLSSALTEAAGPTPKVRLLLGPGPRESIESADATRDAVLVSATSNVRGRLLKLSFDGFAWLESTIDMPKNGAIDLAGASPDESVAFAIYRDFLKPDTLTAIDSGKGTAQPIKSLPAFFDVTDYVSEQFEATSTDGVKIPYFVVHARDMRLDGANPTLLYAYGGFAISMNPTYSPYVGKMWLDRGGVYVMANIRGGGEFGPAWHQAALKTNRQHAYDDFLAVAQDLISRNITSPRRLGIMGGSNGGLLMGVALTQRPDLFHAAVVQVPLLDMLRYDKMLAGASWVDEYGSPAVPAERAFLLKTSPYEVLEKRPDFPTPFFVTSTKDDRVSPAHARKFAAKMAGLRMPFLYYENIEGGHSASANLTEMAERRALEFTYLSEQLID
jgi:prolyl oligopeptidase